MNDSDFIDERELLRRVPVCRRTLIKLRREKDMPYVKIPGGRRVLFHWPSVQAWLLKKTVKPNDR